MADKINAYSRAGLDISQARNRMVGKTERADDAAGQKPAAGASDGVEFSDTSANLKRIEARLRQLPVVDEDRVRALREKIGSGDYQINAERLAEKLVRLEQDLG